MVDEGKRPPAVTGDMEAKWAIYLPIYRQHDLFASSGWAGCTDYQSLLPDLWKKHHPVAIRQYRQEGGVPTTPAMHGNLGSYSAI